MTDTTEPSALRKAIGGFTPITVSGLIMGCNLEPLEAHLHIAEQNGLTETELKEVMTHMAFYAGWPKALSPINVAKHVFAQ